jgi:uncharacterized SAM-binding protein YcdF (DUF218 family)
VRLIAVLGYSGRRSGGLHTVCAERLRHAEQLVGHADAVLLSGWARPGRAGEAALMRAGWSGADVSLITDATARNTRENAAGVAETARRLAATEIVVVTSRWHAFRARTLVRAALLRPGVSVRTSSPPGWSQLALLARELVCLAALPYHLLHLRARHAAANCGGDR